MSEDFLHFVWKFGLLDKRDLKTAAGEEVEIISAGMHNRDSGPDFNNAKIKIGDTLWVGNVEIHVKASEWLAHGHQNDKAYDNVILHAVAINDAAIFRSSGEPVSVITITYPKFIEEQYAALTNSPLNIPCRSYIPAIDDIKIRHWLSRMATERLERKAEYVEELLRQTQSDFDRVFHRLLFRYFGFKANAVPFELLAQNLPAKVLKKYHDSPFILESLLFGQAGLLEDALDDDYYNALKAEYIFLRAKYELTPLDKSLWKFAKLRPGNFPSLRIAQIAELLHRHDDLTEAMLRAGDIREHLAIFDVAASEYWNRHYVFGKAAEKSLPKRIGRVATELIAINVTVPFMFAYAKCKGDSNLHEKALTLLDEIKPESNSTVEEWAKAGVVAASASESQALLHLYSEYCSARKCLQCAIGKIVVGNKHA